MADPILTPSQLKILKLLLDHKGGLTIDEIHDEITKENPEISKDQVKNDLQELVYSYYARQESTNKWVITTPGLTAAEDMPFAFWP
ncbi:MAG: hypothetical protein HXS46_01075 [Theionarchaea archaeon]|nr:hypothetical protein [Theionarchaea archaeon]